MDGYLGTSLIADSELVMKTRSTYPLGDVDLYRQAGPMDVSIGITQPSPARFHFLPKLIHEFGAITFKNHLKK